MSDAEPPYYIPIGLSPPQTRKKWNTRGYWSWHWKHYRTEGLRLKQKWRLFVLKCAVLVELCRQEWSEVLQNRQGRGEPKRPQSAKPNPSA